MSRASLRFGDSSSSTKAVPRLADDLFAALGRPGTISPIVSSAERQSISEYWLPNLRSARRLVLSEDAIWTASRLGAMHPEVILHLLAGCRLPFERTWFEWPLAAALSAVGQKPDADAPKMVGILVMRLGPTSFRATSMAMTSGELDVSAEDGRVSRPMASVGPFSYMYQLDGPMMPESMDEDGLPGMLEENEQLSHLFGRAVQAMPDDEDGDLARRRTACLTLNSHAVVWPTPVVWPVYRNLDREARMLSRRPGMHEMQSRVTRHLEREVNEQNGTFRLLLGILATLNGPGVSAITGHPRLRGANGARMVGARRVPYLDHGTINLLVPREMALRRLYADAAAAGPRRRHEVSGHWRMRHNLGDPRCGTTLPSQAADHTWADIGGEDTSHQQCAVCAARRWWVDEFMRGDACVGLTLREHMMDVRPR